MRDMGLSTVRTKSPVMERIMPNWPTRYATLEEERRALREPLPEPAD